MKYNCTNFSLLISIILLFQVVVSTAQTQKALHPSPEVIEGFMKRSTNTKCELSYDEAQEKWILALTSKGDQLEYSRSLEGIGSPTGSILRTGPEGGLDPTTDGGPLMGKNLFITVCRNGSSYLRQNGSSIGSISTMPKMSSFKDIVPFIGRGTEIRFHKENWVKLGAKKYRNGGFQVLDEGFELLSDTEVLIDGKVVTIE